MLRLRPRFDAPVPSYSAMLQPYSRPHSAAHAVVVTLALVLLLSSTFAMAQSATKPVARKSGFVPQTSVVWRGDIISARGYVNDLVKPYQTEQKGLLTVTPFSTISGIDAVVAGQADIAGSARPMHDKRDEERELVFQPVALDAIVAITHPRNPVGSITLAQLRQLYLGRIKNWNEVGGPDALINLYSIAAPLDGLEYSFRHLLYKRGEQRVGVPRLYLNTSKLEEAIAIDPNGLGLSSLSSVYANKGVKMLAVEGISASSARVADGSYPLFTTLYIVHREDSPNLESIDTFVRYLNSPTALATMRRHQLVPYIEAGDVHALDTQRLAFVDAQIASVTPADVAAMPRPAIAAPRATLQARLGVAPGAESTQQAREAVQQAEALKAAQAAEAARKNEEPR